MIKCMHEIKQKQNNSIKYNSTTSTDYYAILTTKTGL